jgi:hypothetical protein
MHKTLRRRCSSPLLFGFALNAWATIQVSTALNEERWEDAVTLLETMRKPRELPKLGAVQRWVRECDLGATYADNPEVLRVLDAIMRTCGQVWGGIAAAEHAAG